MAWALTPLTEEQRDDPDARPRVRARRDRAAFARSGIATRTSSRRSSASWATLGFLGMLIPEEYDGLGLDTLTYLVALEEIATVDASVAVMLSVHNSLPTQMLLNWGSEEQKERFLKPMARGEMLGAFALSEPEAGSDAASLRTPGRARRRRLDPQRHQGVGVERHEGRRHHRHGAHRHAGRPARARAASARSSSRPICRASASARRKTRWACARRRRCSSTSPTCACPATDLLGDDGQRLHLRHAVARQRPARHRRAGDRHRRGGAARTRSAYAAERKQFGKPIKEFQAIQFKLADMATRVAAARALLHMSRRPRRTAAST